MASYYDDNFGHYNIESEEDVEFFHHMQAESEWKECDRCERKVFISYRYAICNDCANRAEKGMSY